MSKVKKKGKVLVRNASVPVRSEKHDDNSHKLKKVHFSEEQKKEAAPSKDFTSPEFCTLLQLAEEVKKIREWREAVHDVPESKGPIKYRNLNFLPQEKIFQDLVELDAPAEEVEERCQPCPRQLSKKDPEIDYNKYLKYELQPEYFFTSYAVPDVKEPKSTFDGFSIYNKIKMWKNEADCL